MHGTLRYGREGESKAFSVVSMHASPYIRVCMDIWDGIGGRI